MEKNQMKNIVVLKNLPSNLVEEAIIILKSNKTAKMFQYIDKKENVKEEKKLPNDYIISEAESVISSYINAVEKNNKNKNRDNLSRKYGSLKIYSVTITIVLILTMLL